MGRFCVQRALQKGLSIAVVVVAVVVVAAVTVAPSASASGAGGHVAGGPGVTFSPSAAAAFAGPSSRSSGSEASASVPTTMSSTAASQAVTLTVQTSSPTTYGNSVRLVAAADLAQMPGGGTMSFLDGDDGDAVLGVSAVDGSGMAAVTTTGLRAGNHALTASYQVGDTIVSTAAVRLTIDPRPLRLYAQPSRWARPVGAPNPTLQVGVVPDWWGFPGNVLVNGDTLATAVWGKPKFSLLADPSSPPSLYPMELSGLKSANYTLVYVTVSLTVYSRDISVGETVPDFSAHDQNGATFTLSSQRGRVVLLDLSAMWCSGSKIMASQSSTVVSTLQQLGIPFTYVSAQIQGLNGRAATQRDATRWATSFHVPQGAYVLHDDGVSPAVGQPLPTLYDEWLSYGSAPFFADADDGLSVGAFPTLAFIDANGVLRHVNIGPLDSDQVVAQVAAIAP